MRFLSNNISVSELIIGYSRYQNPFPVSTPPLNFKKFREPKFCFLPKFGHVHLQERGCVRIEIDDKSKPSII